MALYMQTAQPFQLKFEIYFFGVMILQMKQKTKFWKIGLCTFKLTYTVQNVCNLIFWSMESEALLVFNSSQVSL